AAATPPSTVVPTSATVTGLTLGTAVEFLVKACNATGCSPFSPASAPFTPVAPTPPAAITDLSASGGVGNASLAWTPPANNGSPITSYTVTTTDTGTLAVTNTSV